MTAHLRAAAHSAADRQVEWSALLPEVARVVWGEPTSRSNCELRFGRQGSKAVNIADGTWYDFEAGEGGGCLDLIKLVFDYDDTEAMSRARRQMAIAVSAYPIAHMPRAAVSQHIVAEYSYNRPDGREAFQVIRFEPKNFRQRHRGPDGNWIWSLDGCEPILYRLPDVLESLKTANYLFVCEGEKDVDALWAIGIPATCGRGGSGGASLWRAGAYSKWLGGVDLAVLWDNDLAGHILALAVAEASVKTCATVFMVDIFRAWPSGADLPKGADVSDWIAAGGTCDQLLQLANYAPPFVKSDFQEGVKALAETQPEMLALAQNGRPSRAAADCVADSEAQSASRKRTNGKTEPTATEVSRTLRGADVSVDEGGISIDDFIAILPLHGYVFIPTREIWPAASVNSILPRVAVTEKSLKAAAWLDQNRAAEQMTWSPGEPMLIEGRLVADGGWIAHDGATAFNLYRPPTVTLGNPNEAGPWLELARKLYRDEADHILDWFAHRVQRPGEKINHAVVLGGAPGIGKDSLLQPLKEAIGAWNFAEISPKALLARFNPFLKSTIVRISEAHDLGEFNRYDFYESSKTLMASPPDTLRIDEKHTREYSIINCCGIIITTNHKSDALYLPADDRRHFVAWSELTAEDFDAGFFRQLWDWYDNGGFGHVAAYLMSRDLTSFDPKAPPPKTAAFLDIVATGQAPEEAELMDVIDSIGRPAAVTLDQLIFSAGDSEMGAWLKERKNRRTIPHRLEACGYTPHRNNDTKNGLFIIGGKRKAVYVRVELSGSERAKAVRELI
jgi:hypothetical protein